MELSNVDCEYCTDRTASCDSGHNNDDEAILLEI